MLVGSGLFVLNYVEILNILMVVVVVQLIVMQVMLKVGAQHVVVHHQVLLLNHVWVLIVKVKLLIVLELVVYVRWHHWRTPNIWEPSAYLWNHATTRLTKHLIACAWYRRGHYGVEHGLLVDILNELLLMMRNYLIVSWTRVLTCLYDLLSGELELALPHSILILLIVLGSCLLQS